VLFYYIPHMYVWFCSYNLLLFKPYISFFCENSADLLIIINSGTHRLKSNKKYKRVFGPPSDDYRHWREPMACLRLVPPSP
jgi:hypothetical protein